MGTKTTLSAQIDAKRTQFAYIGLVRVYRENPLKCRDSAAVYSYTARPAGSASPALELGALAGLRLYGTASARDRAAVERLGAVAIDYRNEDFLARVRELTGGEGVDVVLDALGGPISLRSFRALRPGGRLVVFGRYATLVARPQGLAGGDRVVRGDRRPFGSGASCRPAGGCSPTRSRSSATPPNGAHGAVGGEPRDPEWFREDFAR